MIIKGAFDKVNDLVSVSSLSERDKFSIKEALDKLYPYAKIMMNHIFLKKFKQPLKI